MVPRYTATPMLPKMAMPSAPPNSALVSDMADAAPARSGGAAPMIRSVVNVNTGDVPSEKIIEASANDANPVPESKPVIIQKPMADRETPTGMKTAGRTIRARGGVTKDPTTNASAHGTVQRPASNGDSPSTSCRY